MTTDTTQALRERITAYLSGGGLFNPELAIHTAVRDLLIECRDALAYTTAPAASGARDAPEGFALVPVEPTPEMLAVILEPIKWAGGTDAYRRLLDAARGSADEKGQSK
jgi:hypothetical protein